MHNYDYDPLQELQRMYDNIGSSTKPIQSKKAKCFQVETHVNTTSEQPIDRDLQVQMLGQRELRGYAINETD
ncbi:unnamed protein product, partial [Rotaria socialis]